MIILLDTSTTCCRLVLVEDGKQFIYEWEADRKLARGLLAFIVEKLKIHSREAADIKGVGVFVGPGSFTGLRIGLTVANSLADALDVPIVGAKDDGWQDDALARLSKGENDRMVLPQYGARPHITSPRK